MLRIVLLLLVLAWASIALWSSAKPMPPGTRIASLPARLAESQVTLIHDSAQHREILARELEAIDRADELIVLDQVPVARAIGQRLLLRKRERPNVKIVLVSDPLDETRGGTPAEYLSALEQAGVIVARARLDRLRDVTALYSAFWRLTVSWWSDAFDEPAGGLRSALRGFNLKRDQRALFVADDGSGGFVSIIPAGIGGDLALQIAGGLARDMVASELQIAAWSTNDDRLPLPPPPARYHGLGSIDARFLTEGAIRGALVDALAAAREGDEVSLAARALSDRPLIVAALGAAAHGARVRVLLDPDAQPNRAVAEELSGEGAGHIEVRWSGPGRAADPAALLMVHRRGELWASVGAADYTRLSLGDLNLEAAVELRLPERAMAAHALDDYFAQVWSGAARHAEDPRSGYWRYRFMEAAGLAAY